MSESPGAAAPDTQTAITRCPRCAGETPPGARFCGRCGWDLSAPPPPAIDPTTLRKVCSGCRTVNQAVFSYCYRCGLRLPEQAQSITQAVGNPAGFWVRLSASLIDGAILVTVAAFGMIVATGADPDEATDVLLAASGIEPQRHWLSFIVSVSLDIGYYTVAVGAWGATLGKRLLGLRVVRSEGSRVSYLRALARDFAYVVSFLPLGLGFLSIALSPQKRGWHDFLCDTRVVRTRG